MKNITAVLSSMLFAGLLLGTAGSVYADTLVTFQCDMSYQVQNSTFTNGVSPVYVRTWGPGGTPPTYTNINSVGILLTNDPAGVNTNLYTGTVDYTFETNGAQMQYKFYCPGCTNIPGGPL